jgi:hypothetical protein
MRMTRMLPQAVLAATVPLLANAQDPQANAGRTLYRSPIGPVDPYRSKAHRETTGGRAATRRRRKMEAGDA